MSRRHLLVFSLALAMPLPFGAGCSATAATPGSDGGSDAAGQSDAPRRPDGTACEVLCSLGDRRCVTGGVQLCGDADGDGCFEWLAPISCQTGQKCVNGECVAGCTDLCAEGSVKCTADGTGTQACVVGTSGCREWGSPVPCPGTQTCSSGKCSDECVNECEQGSKQCSGDAVQTCGQHDSDDCLDWGPAVACPSGQTCSNGVCGGSGTCTNECTSGQKECVSSTAFKTCGNFDPDTCLEWSSPTQCPSGQTCSNGTCGTACQDECSPSGTKECTASGTGYKTCGNYDTDTCLEWSLETQCGTGTICQAGACVTACACDYNANVCEPSAPGTTTPCSCDPDCSGGKVPCVSDSHCDTWCPRNTDPDCECTCDYNEYCEADKNYNNVTPRPTPGTEGTCLCDPDCEMHDAACMDDGHCDTWCLPESDPDCGGADPCRERLMSIGWLFGTELLLGGSYQSPDGVEGSPWVLLSPDGWAGEGWGELLVEFAAEHRSCVRSLLFEVYGYDDSWFGDGAEMYLWNWTTGQYDLLSDETVGHTTGNNPAFFQNWVTNTSPYILCGTGTRAKCYVDGRVKASTYDNTHVFWAELFVQMAP